ncbi:M28 family peptidase [Actinomadura rugatobispora]|uniref:M28 family peptidase n=1 Tax=Actinomadura rugatobispora TaxID=1994 RepID=A0ABW0ZNZ6_9ACTN|nr:aminopeptidase PaaP [Actinomadura rugatobispora]
MRRLATGAAALLTGSALSAALVAVPRAPATAAPDLAGLVRIADVRRHLEALQEISDYNGGNRAVSRPGYDVSVKYVVARLKKAGFTPRVQPFEYEYWEQRTPAVFAQTAPGQATYKPEEQFQTMQYSGAGDVTASAAAVDVPASGQAGTAGCEAADFQGFASGSVALIQRGGCSFEAKAANARAAGAGALVVFNLPAEQGLVNGTLGKAFPLPVVETPHALGAELTRAAQAGGLKLRVRTDTVTGTRTSSNVIAETGRGRDDNVVVVGAHLDSVPEGPGINDNGSGSAALLAVAEKISRLGAAGLRNKVRFAWWGAEEEGLLGSEYYVGKLSDNDRAKIALNLNFDMLGSVNGVRGVYDGDGSLGGGTAPPPGSGAIEKIFKDYYAGRGLPTLESEFTGRSDYGPFIQAGIPAGGLFSGAEVVKTAEQAALFGGEAGKPYDPCYHTACDTLANIDWKLLDAHVDGVAFATQRLAASTLPVNGETRRPASSAQLSGQSAGAGFDWRGDHLVR